MTADNYFIIYEPNFKTVKTTFCLEDLEKISRYQDNSWEIKHKSGKSYRFIAANSEEWFNKVYSSFNEQKNSTKALKNLNEQPDVLMNGELNLDGKLI